MSNAIRFLEAMGNDASRGRLSAAEYANAVAQLDADESQRRALMERDHAALNDTLGGRVKMLHSIFPAQEEEETDDDQCEQQSEPVKRIAQAA